MIRNLLLKAAIISAISATISLSTFAESITSSDQALDALIENLKNDKVYNNRMPSFSCISFLEDGSTRDYYDFTLYEVHNEECGGDPGSSHVIDRFRVFNKDKAIFWYNIAEGDYLPYDDFIKSK